MKNIFWFLNLISLKIKFIFNKKILKMLMNVKYCNNNNVNILPTL